MREQRGARVRERVRYFCAEIICDYPLHIRETRVTMAFVPQRSRMADLRINDIEQSLLDELKIKAIKDGKTLRGYVMDLLRNAAYPWPKQRTSVTRAPRKERP